MKIGDDYFCEECKIKLDGDFEGQHSHTAMCANCDQPHHFCTKCAEQNIPNFGSPNIELTKEQFEKNQREYIPPAEFLDTLTLVNSVCGVHEKFQCSICGEVVMKILNGIGMIQFIDKDCRIAKPTHNFMAVCCSGKEIIEVLKDEVWNGLYKVVNDPYFKARKGLN